MVKTHIFLVSYFWLHYSVAIHHISLGKLLASIYLSFLICTMSYSENQMKQSIEMTMTTA